MFFTEMAKIPIKGFLTILLAVCCQCRISENPADSSSWAKLKISPDTFSSRSKVRVRIEIEG
jgi:hypothetical protein